MSEQINETYFAWLNKRIDKYEPPSREEVWNAATAEANKRIAELEGEIARLSFISTTLKDNVDELQASNNRLREALEMYAQFSDSRINETAKIALSASPAHSLIEFENSVIEKAFIPTEKIIVAIENEVQSQLVASGINEVMHRLDGQYIFDAAIRALKEVK